VAGVARMIFHLPIFVFAFVALFFVVGHAHSDLKFRAGSVNCSDHPPVISYHIHIVFMLTNNGQIQRASDLRDQAQKEFSQFFGKESACKGTSQEPSGRYGNCVVRSFGLILYNDVTALR
jgi:hypothetical protein